MNSTNRESRVLAAVGSIFKWVAIVGWTFIALILITSWKVERPPLPRWLCRDNLKAMGVALFLYHEKYGSYPPAYVADESGKPMHSWRVLILPFLAEADSKKYAKLMELYQAYRFDEPWDGPNNRKLADQTPDVFHCPAAPKESASFTSYAAIVGGETAWPGTKAVSRDDLRDGIALTLLIVEQNTFRIRWTEPVDLHFDQMSFSINANTHETIGSPHTGGANVLCADSTVRFVDDNVDRKIIRGLLTIAGGEVIDDGDF